ncbi:hypothetical protein SAMN05444747_101105 [Variovorax sp. OV329]|nr:hypothetical protein SAMN05444747_101105 [Variovorax sp. OV329]
MMRGRGGSSMPLPPTAAAAAAAVLRPVPELPRRVPYRTLGVSALILALIALFVGGLTAWNRSVPGGRPIPAGLELEAGRGVYYRPADDWKLDTVRSRTGSVSAIFHGANRFTVRVLEWRGGPEGPLLRQRARFERGQRLAIEGEPEPFKTSGGLQGMSFGYFGPTLSGRYWQITDVSRQRVVQVDFHSVPEGAENSLDEAEEMVDSLRLEARP